MSRTRIVIPLWLVLLTVEGNYEISVFRKTKCRGWGHNLFESRANYYCTPLHPRFLNLFLANKSTVLLQYWTVLLRLPPFHNVSSISHNPRRGQCAVCAPAASKMTHVDSGGAEEQHHLHLLLLTAGTYYYPPPGGLLLEGAAKPTAHFFGGIKAPYHLLIKTIGTRVQYSA